MFRPSVSAKLKETIQCCVINLFVDDKWPLLSMIGTVGVSFICGKKAKTWPFGNGGTFKK